MRYWYDTEFLEDGRTIDLISIGIVAEDGREYYAVAQDAPWERIVEHPWLRDNVIPYLPFTGDRLDDTDEAVRPRAQIARQPGRRPRRRGVQVVQVIGHLFGRAARRGRACGPVLQGVDEPRTGVLLEDLAQAVAGAVTDLAKAARIPPDLTAAMRAAASRPARDPNADLVVSWTAACPGCGGQACWTVRLPASRIGPARDDYRIDCDCAVAA